MRKEKVKWPATLLYITEVQVSGIRIMIDIEMLTYIRDSSTDDELSIQPAK